MLKLLYLSALTPEIPNLSLYEAWMKLSLTLRKEQKRNHPYDGPLSTGTCHRIH